MRSKHYLIPIPPIGWKRAGINQKRFFDTQEEEKLAFGLHVSQQHGGDPLFSGPLSLEVTFYCRPPKEIKKRKHPYYHITTPDLDNFLKFLLDACHDIVFDNDCIIAEITATKVYDKEARVEFTIRSL